MKTLTIFLISISISLTGFAQHWEGGLFLGVSNYAGDLSPSFFLIKEAHPAFGPVVRYNVNRYVSFKGNLFYGTISGNDVNQVKQSLQVRNLSFKSNILELGVTAEYNIFGFDGGGNRFSPYVFAGIAVYRFNPKTLYQGQWVALQPLGTEGQGTPVFPNRKPYSLTQLSMPLGAGIKYAIGRGWNLGLEVGYRKTYTDYLDDVSKSYVDTDIIAAYNGATAAALSNRTGEVLPEPLDFNEQNERGNAKYMDWYMFGGITLTYTFGSSNKDHSGYNGGPVHKCYSF